MIFVTSARILIWVSPVDVSFLFTLKPSSINANPVQLKGGCETISINTAANLVEKEFLVGLFHISIIITIAGFHKKKFVVVIGKNARNTLKLN